LRAAINPYGVIGFGIAAAFAIVQKWSLPEFCWSTWLAGLVYAWTCILTASIQIILTATEETATYERLLPFLRRYPRAIILPGITVISILTGLLAFRLYTFLFGFYGIFLSIFSEMAPLSMFGRNGFINSDFFTPVMNLLDRFWPMAAGALITNWKDFIRKNPWKRIVLPFQKEILRIHIMILALPFFAMMAWALFRGAYQSITIVLLMGLIYLLPKKIKET
jgi:hypothetical protein